MSLGGVRRSSYWRTPDRALRGSFVGPPVRSCRSRPGGRTGLANGGRGPDASAIRWSRGGAGRGVRRRERGEGWRVGGGTFDPPTSFVWKRSCVVCGFWSLSGREMAGRGRERSKGLWTLTRGPWFAFYLRFVGHRGYHTRTRHTGLQGKLTLFTDLGRAGVTEHPRPGRGSGKTRRSATLRQRPRLFPPQVTTKTSRNLSSVRTSTCSSWVPSVTPPGGTVEIAPLSLVPPDQETP